MLRQTLFCAAILSASSAFGIVIPNDRAGTAGTGVFLGPLTSTARTYQLLVDDSQLTGLAGQQIFGMRFRLPPSATASFPLANGSYTSFDVRMSGSVEPSARSLTFASNVVGAQTLVRSGPLTITAGAYPSGSSPNGFGPTIVFDSPYLYVGGNMLMEFRHTGQNAGGSPSVDAVTTGTAGYGTLFSAAWTGSFDGLTGAQGNAIVTDFVIVPEPAVTGLLVAGVGLLIRRRSV